VFVDGVEPIMASRMQRLCSRARILP